MSAKRADSRTDSAAAHPAIGAAGRKRILRCSSIHRPVISTGSGAGCGAGCAEGDRWGGSLSRATGATRGLQSSRFGRGLDDLRRNGHGARIHGQIDGTDGRVGGKKKSRVTAKTVRMWQQQLEAKRYIITAASAKHEGFPSLFPPPPPLSRSNLPRLLLPFPIRQRAFALTASKRAVIRSMIDPVEAACGQNVRTRGHVSGRTRERTHGQAAGVKRRSSGAAMMRGRRCQRYLS